ncbi:MAG: GxxExxY protein [Opitutales bacterium]|nr:GxxExxY protein [Opitutales bacterium]
MKSEKFTPNSGSADGFLLQETCYKITGCAIDILNALGPGLKESVYSACLKIEMDKRGIAYQSDCVCPLIYEDTQVGEVSVPFVVEGRLVVACVVSEHFNETDYSRYISCLRALDLSMALLLNFQFGKLQWRKIQA